MEPICSRQNLIKLKWNNVILIETYTEVQQDTLITEAKAQAGGQTLCCKQAFKRKR
ncbi:hypothetical protein WJX82_010117 [Trebouxia sp. C0006]